MNRIAGMNGPEHFLAGEYKLQQVSHLDPGADKETARLHATQIAEAQAHFAAAQALCYGALVADGDLGEVSQAWQTLLGIKADGE